MLYTQKEIDLVLCESELQKLFPAFVFTEVNRQYNSPIIRNYHDFDHAISVLSWVNHVCQRFSELSLYPYTYLELRLAALFHDIVYDNEGSPSNEQRSTELMSELLSPVRVLTSDSLERVKRLILLTAEHGKLESHDVKPAEGFMLDCDIANMGEPRWEIFLWNNQNVVKELELKYTQEELAAGRKDFLREMLEKRSIYMTPYFQQMFELQAKANLRRLLEET